MNTQTSRRSLLQGAVMLTAAPVAAMGGVPVFGVVGEPEPVEAETPIQRLLHRWEAILVKHDQDCRAAEAQAEAQGKLIDFNWEEQIIASTEPERHRIEDAILAEPPNDLRDLAIKVLVNSGEGAWALDDKLTLELAKLAGRDFGSLPRCLFEPQI